MLVAVNTTKKESAPGGDNYLILEFCQNAHEVLIILLIHFEKIFFFKEKYKL